MEKSGNQLKSVIGVHLGGGKYTRFLFCQQTHVISGLSRFLRMYHICRKYTLLFAYIGDSEFHVTVYDAHGMDYFRDMEGNFTMAKALNEEYVNTNMNSSVNSGSTIDGTFYDYHT